jgi:Zn-finger nucleic acid-binding protein
MAPQPYPVRQDQYGHGQGHGYDPRYGKKRRKSFLEELFD